MVTGHRPQFFSPEEKDFALRSLLSIANKCKNELGMVEAISGMAIGVDTWWAEAAIRLDLELAAYIPFPQQPDRWYAKDKQKWQELRDKASREVILGESFSMRLLHMRNHSMIKDSDLAVAVWKPSKQDGGTYAAVKKLRAEKRPLIIVDMDNLKIFTENMG